MGLKKFSVLSGFIIFVLAVTFIAFAEESVEAPAGLTNLSDDQQVTPVDINETQWAWGEVTSLDTQAKTLTLKYLDYETDQEKELVLSVDEKTVFENIKNLDEIKTKDTLSVDYLAEADGKNTVKNINFEKSDSASTVAPSVEEIAKPVEVAGEPVADTVAQAAAPEETPAAVETPVAAPVEVPVVVETPVATPAPVEISIPLDSQSTVQPEAVTQSPAPINEAPAATPVSTTAVQEGQAQ